MPDYRVGPSGEVIFKRTEEEVERENLISEVDDLKNQVQILDAKVSYLETLVYKLTTERR